MLCPCQSNKLYEECCALLHYGQPAPTALALMRSRYSAFVLGLDDYLLQTWHPDTRPQALNLSESNVIWRGLRVLKHTQEQTTDRVGYVEFIALYDDERLKRHQLHEKSQFIKEKGRWYYYQPSP